MSALEKAKSLFLAAIERGPSGECATFLDKACGGDVALRDRLERLLEAHRILGAKPVPGADATGDLPSFLEGPGTVIGPYKLLEQIGEGGMGQVFMAEQTAPVRRRVALKIIKPGMDSRQVIARFEAERQALAMMDHSNIARVLDAGATATGRPYFVMELVHGIPITEYCDRERLRVPARLELFVLVCRAVQHAHQKGIIHRDIKPSNVLITLHDGIPVPKIIDFGIAKATGQSLTDKTLFTGFAQLVGTPLYMSPEQAELSGLDIDTRSDIYALGVLLYELLTGSTPFDGETLREAAFDEMRRIIREEEPPKPSTRLGTLGKTLSTVSARRGSDPRRLDHAVRGELDWIVMKALEKDRRRRYETANDFAADVTRHLTDRPVEACPPSRRYRFGKYVRRNRTILITMGLVAIVLIAGAVVSTWQAFRATIAERRTMSALAAVERNERINRRFWYGSQVRLTQQALSAGQVDFAQEALERLRPMPDEPDLRGFEWHYLRRLAHRDASLLFGHESPVYALALSPDGHTLVSGDQQGILVFWDLVAWRERARVSGHEHGVGNLVFAPDGRTVVSSDFGSVPGEVKLWDPATGRESARVPGISAAVCELGISRDGRTLVVCDRRVDIRGTEGRVTLWNLSPDRAITPAEVPTIASDLFGISPDHRWLATASRSGEVTLRDASTGRPIRNLLGPESYVKALGFTQDGRSILVHNQKSLIFFDPATGAEQQRVDSWATDGPGMSWGVNLFRGLPLRHGNEFWLTDARSHLRPTILEGVSGNNLRFQFSPDGRTLAGAGEFKCATLWDVASGRKRAEYPSPARAVRTLAFTSRGESLFFGSSDAKVRLWHIEKRPDPLSHLSSHDKEVWALAYTPDGRTLASAADDHTIKLWNPHDGILRNTLTGHLSLVSSLAVSPDGKTLASGSFDRTVRLWDLPSGRARVVLSGHTERVRGVAFSPDGQLLAASSSDGTIRIWDSKGGRKLTTLRGPGDGLHDLAFDHDGSRLVSACNSGALWVWDLTGGREPLTIPGPNACVTAAFSEDGSLLASGDDRGGVFIWDAETWDRRIAIKGSDAAIRELSFSPDGRTLAAACDDAKIRLWDPATGQLTLLLDGHPRRVNAVAFSPDGSTLSSASHDGAIKLWSVGRP